MFRYSSTSCISHLALLKWSYFKKVNFISEFVRYISIEIQIILFSMQQIHLCSRHRKILLKKRIFLRKWNQVITTIETKHKLIDQTKIRNTLKAQSAFFFQFIIDLGGGNIHAETRAKEFLHSTIYHSKIRLMLSKIHVIKVKKHLTNALTLYLLP